MTFQRVVNDINDSGESTPEWTNWRTRWASVEPLQAREYWQAQEVQSQVTHKVTIRHMDGLKFRHRILWGERILNIESIINGEGRDIDLVILCREETT
mgnify:FL=1